MRTGGQADGRTAPEQPHPVAPAFLPSAACWAGSSWPRQPSTPVALVMVLVVSQQDQRRPVDAIVVLGAAQYNGRPVSGAPGPPQPRAAPLPRGARAQDHRDRRHGAGRYHQRSHGRPAVSGESRRARRGRGGAGSGPVHPGLDDRRGRVAGAGGSAAGAAGERSLPYVSTAAGGARTDLEAYTSPTEDSPISDNPVLELRYLFAEGFKIPVAWFRAAVSPLTSHSRSL